MGAYLPTIMEFVVNSTLSNTFHTYCCFDQCDWDYVNGIHYDNDMNKGNITERQNRKKQQQEQLPDDALKQIQSPQPITQQQEQQEQQLPPALSLLHKFQRYFPNNKKNPHQLFQFNQQDPKKEKNHNDLVTNFICQTLPKATRTCLGLKNGEIQIPPQLNEAIHRARMDYEYVLQEAYTRYGYDSKCMGTVRNGVRRPNINPDDDDEKNNKNITDDINNDNRRKITRNVIWKTRVKKEQPPVSASFLRKQMSQSMRDYHHHTISKCPPYQYYYNCTTLYEFPLICPTDDERRLLTRKTVQFETMMFDESDSDIIQSLAMEKMYNNSKYCVTDVDQTLQDPRWDYFFRKILPSKFRLQPCN